MGLSALGFKASALRDVALGGGGGATSFQGFRDLGFVADGSKEGL